MTIDPLTQKAKDEWLAARRAASTPPMISNADLYKPGGMHHPDAVSHGVMPPRDAGVARAERAANDQEEKRLQAFIPAMVSQRQGVQDARDAKREASLYATAFRSYIRNGLRRMPTTQRNVLDLGQRELSQQEERDLGTVTGGVGGYLAPQAFFDRVVKAQKLLSGVRKAAFVFQTDTGSPMPIPMDNDTANVGERLTENTVATTLDTTFTSKTLGAYTYSSKIVKVGLALAQDSKFPIEAYLAGKLGLRIGRAQNIDFTTGTGTNQPQGIVTGAFLGKTGTAGQTILYADLVDLEHSVDAAYRGGRQLLSSGDISDDPSMVPTPAWMMNDSTLKVLQKLTDTQQRPIYQAGLAGLTPDTLLGYPIVLNSDMPALGLSSKAVLFGDMSQYVIRDAGPVAVLRLSERFADSFEVGFICFARADGAVLDGGTHPIAYFQQAAS